MIFPATCLVLDELFCRISVILFVRVGDDPGVGFVYLGPDHDVVDPLNAPLFKGRDGIQFGKEEHKDRDVTIIELHGGVCVEHKDFENDNPQGRVQTQEETMPVEDGRSAGRLESNLFVSGGCIHGMVGR